MPGILRLPKPRIDGTTPPFIGDDYDGGIYNDDAAVTTTADDEQPPQEAPTVADWTIPQQQPRQRLSDVIGATESPYRQVAEVVKKGPPPLPKLSKGRMVADIAAGFMLGPQRAQQIMHPVYSRQVEEYGRQLGNAELAAKIDAEELERKRRMAESEARIGSYGASEAYNDARREQLGRPKPDTSIEISPDKARELGVLPSADGKYRIPGAQISVLKPPVPKAPKQTEEEKIAERIRVADANGLKGDERQRYIYGTPMRRENSGGEKPATKAQWRAVEMKKSDRMATLKREALKAEKKLLEDASVLPAEKEKKRLAIWDEYNDQMKDAQNYYNSEIIALGGSISPQPDATPKPDPGAKPGAPKVYKITNPKTGETRTGALSESQVQDAKRQGFQVTE